MRPHCWAGWGWLLRELPSGHAVALGLLRALLSLARFAPACRCSQLRLLPPPADEDDPFARMPKLDGDKDGKDSLDTAVALRRPKPTMRRGASGAPMGFLTLLPPGRKSGDLAAAAAAAAEAAARASAAAKKVQNLQERVQQAITAFKPAQDTPSQPPAGSAQQPAEAQAGTAQQAAGAQQPAGKAQQPAEAQQPGQPQELAARLAQAPPKVTPGGPPPLRDFITIPIDLGGGVSGVIRQYVPPEAEAATAPAAAGESQPAASVVASRPPAGTEGPREPATATGGGAAVPGLALPAASAAPATAPGAAGPAAAGKVDASAAASKAAAQLMKRGDRVAYRGKLHPSLGAAQERLEQLQQAISRVEASSSARAREYLPQLLVSRWVFLGGLGLLPCVCLWQWQAVCWAQVPAVAH